MTYLTTTKFHVKCQGITMKDKTYIELYSSKKERLHRNEPFAEWPVGITHNYHSTETREYCANTWLHIKLVSKFISVNC